MNHYLLAAIGTALATGPAIACWRVWRVFFSKGYDPYRLRRPLLEPAEGELSSAVARDGRTIRYRWLWGPRPAVIVIAGGYRARMQEFAALARGINRRGYSVVIFDWRGSARDGQRVTGGVGEVLDLTAVVDAAHRRCPEASIGVVGLSFGGSMTVLAAAGGAPIDAMWLDGAFANPYRTMAHMVRRRLRLWGSHIIIWPPIVALWLCTGAWLPSVRVEHAASRVQGIPTQVVVAELDRLVPAEATRRLAAAAGWSEAQHWVVPQVGHIEAFRRVRNDYVQRLDAFFTGAFVARTEPVTRVRDDAGSAASA